ncbi:DEKNAAC100939 [Brettanomyces naardenensis]|uniref:DEKNAAC100939 n=1 Tax=Brettanomyces naardenensis TaxID=13370 RepID=A0A448YH13_BRENA|nr:DEKNAAC100939 [Brettanomyces naardenensis]
MSRKTDPSLNTYDPNSAIPTDAPPSYEQAMSDPSIDVNQPQSANYARPTVSAPPARPQLPVRPPVNTAAQDLYTNNLNLPWRYPKGYYCKKCKNTGYDKKGKRCKKCWELYGKSHTKPSNAYLPPARPRPPAPPPVPLNPAVVRLPPGRIVRPFYGSQGATVVQPGDPRIGGQLCPRCHGRGQVHFFLDMETCPVCGGLGRTG